MDPMAVDMLVCLDVGQGSDKTQLADAVGAEAGSRPVTGRVLRGSGVPDVSKVIQSMRCSLTAERLFGGFGVRILGKLISRCLGFKLENMSCKAAALSIESIGRVLWRLVGLSGFDPKRTFRF